MSIQQTQLFQTKFFSYEFDETLDLHDSDEQEEETKFPRFAFTGENKLKVLTQAQ